MDKILIGGEERELYCKMSTIAKFVKQEGIGTEDLMQMGLYESMRLVWYMLKDGARRAGKKFPHTMEDVIDWLDDGGMSEDSPFSQAMKFFGETMAGISGEKEETANSNPEEVKN